MHLGASPREIAVSLAPPLTGELILNAVSKAPIRPLTPGRDRNPSTFVENGVARMDRCSPTDQILKSGNELQGFV
jgi:hypothetical protein